MKTLNHINSSARPLRSIRLLGAGLLVASLALCATPARVAAQSVRQEMAMMQAEVDRVIANVRRGMTPQELAASDYSGSVYERIARQQREMARFLRQIEADSCCIQNSGAGRIPTVYERVNQQAAAFMRDMNIIDHGTPAQREALLRRNQAMAAAYGASAADMGIRNSIAASNNSLINRDWGHYTHSAADYYSALAGNYAAAGNYRAAQYAVGRAQYYTVAGQGYWGQ